MVTGVDSVPANITFSFIKLQRLRASFDELRAGGAVPAGQERTLRRLTAELGATALPLLLRELTGADVTARWAHALLRQMGAPDSDCRERAIERLRLRADGAGADDAARARAVALLAEIGAEAADEPVDDPIALRDNSLRELARCLDTAAEVARAADLLVVQLDADELLSFLDDFAAREPARAAALIDELLVRDDIDERTRSELRRLRAPLRAAHRSPRSEARPTVRIGEHRDGRCAVVATLRRGARQPPRYRALWAVIDAHGELVDAGYCSELTGGAIKRDILDPMRSEGFTVERAQVRTARTRLVGAARAAIAAGGELPSDFYLGRDILGLSDEHWVQSRDAYGDMTALFARAIDLLSIGEYARARPLLERYVEQRGDDAEAVANLGICLMAMGEPAAACTRIERAVALEPAQAMHRWNLAAAAHRAGRRGCCYLALVDYLARADEREGADERRASARSFVAEYERLARLEHPGRDPRLLARGE